MRDVARSYENMTVEVPQSDEESFKESIIDNVGVYMQEKYGDLLSTQHQKEIMENVKQAV